MQHKTYLNWSSGKDAAMALYRLQQDPEFNVDRLLTSVNATHDRVSMHGVRRELLLAQSEALALPCTTIELPELPSMEDYETLMGSAVRQLKQEGYDFAAFGDIFLDDLRTYREKQLARLGMQAVFPLWKMDTTSLLRQFMALGFKAVVVCVDAALLDPGFAGRMIDEAFLKALPPGVDPCGENGEYHSFCFDGPVFKNPVSFDIGEKVYREYNAPADSSDKEHQVPIRKTGCWFCDLLPKTAAL